MGELNKRGLDKAAKQGGWDPKEFEEYMKNAKPLGDPDKDWRVNAIKEGRITRVVDIDGNVEFGVIGIDDSGLSRR